MYHFHIYESAAFLFFRGAALGRFSCSYLGKEVISSDLRACAVLLFFNVNISHGRVVNSKVHVKCRMLDRMRDPTKTQIGQHCSFLGKRMKMNRFEINQPFHEERITSI